MRWMRVLAACFVVALTGQAHAQMPRAPVAVEYGLWSPVYALAQQRAMDKALEALQPRAGVGRTVYVLAAALYGQHVFQNEAAQAAAALARHFNAQNRTIVLSNYYTNAVPAYPAATPTNFQAAIGRMAELMDKNTDVAVIFLTSHGGHNSGLAGFEPLPGADRDALREFAVLPGRLRGALDLAGIRNRIIILSACYSGQFIPTLQDANTIVLTAASPERTSFGCHPENDWTYFGDAMFNYALPKSTSLMAAFDLAKTQISAAETSQRLVPSQPQSFVGANAQKYLAEIERR